MLEALIIWIGVPLIMVMAAVGLRSRLRQEKFRDELRLRRKEHD